MFELFENNNETLLFRNKLYLLNSYFPEQVSYNIFSIIYFTCDQCGITFKDNIQEFRIGNTDEIIITCFTCALDSFYE